MKNIFKTSLIVFQLQLLNGNNYGSQSPCSSHIFFFNYKYIGPQVKFNNKYQDDKSKENRLQLRKAYEINA